MNSYEDGVNYSIDNLISYMKIKSGDKKAETDFEKRFVHGMDNSPSVDEIEEEVIQIAKEDLNRIPIDVDNETAYQLCALKCWDEKLFDVILNDIKESYKELQKQLVETRPDWKSAFPLTDIDLKIITEDDDWKHFCYINELDELTLPNSGEAIMVIQIRFRKKHSKLRYSLELEFLDVVALVNEKTVESTHFIHATYVQNKDRVS